MKQKKIDTKLVLNKRTVFNLNHDEMKDVYGGADTGFTVCVSNCVTNCTCAATRNNTCYMSCICY